MEIFIYIEIDNKTLLVGQLWHRIKNGRESSSFEYDKSWLSYPERFALEPALKLGVGQYQTKDSQSIFGSIGDSAPDRWGRVLMRRANSNVTSPRSLNETDYLLMVDDKTRQGALRFKTNPEGQYLSSTSKVRIPPLIELPKLITASEKIINNDESYKDILLLLDPGSSLGGARPKSSICYPDGSLAIAKFPRKDDYDNIEGWEAVALTLAQLSNINTPSWEYRKVGDKPVLLVKRFDRVGKKRIPFISAMSMLGSTDNQKDKNSYLEIVDSISQYSNTVKEDMHELYKRIALNILISNTDDHLRNHAFLYDSYGWSLSPVYDINPTPVEIKPRILSLNIDFDDAAASIDTLLSVSEEFRLKQKEAKKIIQYIGKAVSQWHVIAKKQGLSKNEIERMASAFEHEDQKIVKKLNHKLNS